MSLNADQAALKSSGSKATNVFSAVVSLERDCWVCRSPEEFDSDTTAVSEQCPCFNSPPCVLSGGVRSPSPFRKVFLCLSFPLSWARSSVEDLARSPTMGAEAPIPTAISIQGLVPSDAPMSNNTGAASLHSPCPPAATTAWDWQQVAQEAGLRAAAQTKCKAAVLPLH